MAVENNTYSFSQRMNYTRITIFLFLLASQVSLAQLKNDTLSMEYILSDVNARQTNVSRMAMTSLNGWAISNIAYGGLSYSNAQGKERYFHQMNVFWNVVNLSIGIPGLIGTYKERPQDFESTYKYQKKLENVYVLNMGLDLGYIATGWSLDNFGKSKTGDLADRFKGYGNSLVMQGSYLFIHDLFIYFIYKTNHKSLDLVWKNVTIRPTGTGVLIDLPK